MFAAPLQTSAMEMFEIIVDSITLKPLAFLAKKVLVTYLTGSKMCLWIRHSSRNSSRDISLTLSKDGIILINSLQLKFRVVNSLSISRSSKQLPEVFV